jgi:UDPglucose 6-dehydrogenase
MTITVIGGGYVGLTTGICLSYVGHDVNIVEKDHAKFSALELGNLPIYEPGLDDLLQKSRSRITFSNKVNRSLLNGSELIIIAVGTPPKDDGDADLTFLHAAVEEVLSCLDGDVQAVVAIKSTVPVGTNDMLAEKFGSMLTGHRVQFVSNPEFLREGHAVYDTLYPDRIVVGARDRDAVGVLREAYGPILQRSFVKPDFITDGIEKDLPYFIVTTPKSAELVKYASNAFLALKISYINEIAMLCEKVGANVEDVALGMGTDSRIGRSFLNAGIGWGGSCFPKDTSALIRTGEKHGSELSIVRAAVKVNDNMKEYFVKNVESTLGGLQGKTVAVLGLSFKPDTDDVRDSPAMELVDLLVKKGAIVKATDPIALENARKALPQSDKVIYEEDVYKALEGVDCVLITTEWPHWSKLDFDRVGRIVRQKLIFDGRNCLDKELLEGLGFIYKGVGR